MKQRFAEIPIEQLFPNPRNPRKSLGDISELAASIRQNGVMQNLTVVERDAGGYTIVIGHRRCAAAKEAGLEHLPCAIAQMDEAEQFAVMMLENIQRNDLTAYEQAEGFQIMLDLGDTIKGISEKTGISQSTVRRRVKLAELDREELRIASEKQITFDELDRLFAIKDADERNEVLSRFGTAQYAYEYDRAIRAQQNREQEEIFRRALTAAGASEVEHVYGSGYVTEAQAQTTCAPEVLTKKMMPGTEYYFGFYSGWCHLMMKQVSLPVKETRKKKSAGEIGELERKLADLREATKRAYRLRTQFIISRREKDCLDHINDIIAFLTKNLWMGGAVGGSYRISDMVRYVGGSYENGSKAAESICSFHTRAFPARTLFYDACAIAADIEDRGFFGMDGSYVKNRVLGEFYEFLFQMGYEPCREEEELMNGTSALFYRRKA